MTTVDGRRSLAILPNYGVMEAVIIAPFLPITGVSTDSCALARDWLLLKSALLTLTLIYYKQT